MPTVLEPDELAGLTGHVAMLLERRLSQLGLPRERESIRRAIDDGTLRSYGVIGPSRIATIAAWLKGKK